MNCQIDNAEIVSWAKSYDGPLFHGVICDPPYELGFMGKKWDNTGIAFQPDTWSAISSILHPGAHLLAFGGTRTFHRLACAIEDAGFEIRDTLMWVYGSGFPKSHDVSKAIDREQGAEREVVAVSKNGSGPSRIKLANHAKGDTGIGIYDGSGKVFEITAASTDQAKQWNGYGTALKPAYEPVILARKPIEGTVAANVQKYGCGAINIDGCRVEFASDDDCELSRINGLGPVERFKTSKQIYGGGKASAGFQQTHSPKGRWPANLIHDGSQQVLDLFPNTTSGKMLPHHQAHESENRSMSGKNYARTGIETYGDSGSAARFFYCAKASKKERDEGLDGLPVHSASDCVDREPDSPGMNSPRAGAGRTNGTRNHHPTVKPIALCSYLAKLILPPTPNCRILVPFAGSGSEMIGAYLAGWQLIQGVEKEADYTKIANARLDHWTNREINRPPANR